MGTDTCISVGTSLASLGLSGVILALSLRSPHFGSVLSTSGGEVAESKWCDDVYIQNVRPFQFNVGSSGPYSCPWPTENLVFRGGLGVVCILGTLSAMFFVYKGTHAKKLKYASLLFAVCAACWLSVGTLDADSLRSGNALCRADFDVGNAGSLLENADKLSCAPWHFAWMVVLDFFAVAVFGLASFVWLRFTRESSTAKHSQLSGLQDPFLASQGHEEDGRETTNYNSPNYAYEPVVTPMQQEMTPSHASFGGLSGPNNMPSWSVPAANAAPSWASTDLLGGYAAPSP